METETTSTPKQRSQRSNSYPSYTIQECIELTKLIYSNYGSSTYISRDQIAKLLGLSESGAVMRISSCTQYDLLDLKSGDGYKPSIHFVKIHKPLTETEKKEALLHCFSSPKLYADLITEFKDGIVPYAAGLGTILFRKHSISEPVSEKAAIVFIENAKYLNFLNSENILTLNSSPPKTVDSSNIALSNTEDIPNKEEENNSSIILKDQSEPQKSNNSQNNNYQVGVLPFNIPLKGRRKAQIIIPEDLNKEDFDTIIKWVYLMKESYE